MTRVRITHPDGRTSDGATPDKLLTVTLRQRDPFLRTEQTPLALVALELWLNAIGNRSVR